MEKVPAYSAIFNKLGFGESQMLDKLLYEEEVRTELCGWEGAERKGEEALGG